MNAFMKIAKELADVSIKTNAGGPFGACVVKNGKIIGKGYNQVLVNHDPTAHAEIEAIRDACKHISSYDLSDCDLYTTSFPCPMCLSAVLWANIKKVYYGNSKEDTASIGFRDDFIYQYIANLLEEKQEEGILFLECMNREETLKIYEKYASKKDKKLY